MVWCARKGCREDEDEEEEKDRDDRVDGEICSAKKRRIDTIVDETSAILMLKRGILGICHDIFPDLCHAHP